MTNEIIIELIRQLGKIIAEWIKAKNEKKSIQEKQELKSTDSE